MTTKPRSRRAPAKSARPAASAKAATPAKQAQASKSPKKSPIPQTLLRIVNAALDDMKAVNVKVMDVRQLTDITDVVVIASGNRTVLRLAFCMKARPATPLIDGKA